MQVEKEAEQKVGNIVIASNAQEKPVTGKVIVVSTQTVGELQKPTAVSEGDTVVFDKYAGQEIHVEGQDYLVVHEKDIIAVI
nr:co-chaperone GroES [Leuconostoc fallax]